MQIEHLIAFNLALLVAVASPGPAMLMAIRATLSESRRAGIATGAGLAVMSSVWTLVALLGLDAVFQLFPWAYTAAKTLGALYLLYLAWSTWRGANEPLATDTRTHDGRAFRTGLLVNLANPKAVLFAAAVLVVIFPAGTSGLAKTIITTNQFVVEIIFYSALAFTMDTDAVRKRYLQAKGIFDRLAALVLGTLGARLLLHRAAD